MSTLYDRLAVSRDAPPEVIRAAYRALSQRHHPDRNPGDASAASAMQAINEAYAVLADPLQRRAYDATLAAMADRVRTCSSVAAPIAAAAPCGGARSRAAAPATRMRRRRAAAVLAVLAAAALFSASIAVWRASPREAAPPLPVADVVEWRIHGVDSGPRASTAGLQEPGRSPQAGRPAAATAPIGERARTTGSPAPPRPAAAAPRLAAVSASTAVAGLPIVADPNGRPWPFDAAYVDGLPQTRLDGHSSVVLDNAVNPAPMFVTLVALDDAASEPIRHVYVPAMGAFRIGSLPPGRYAVQHRNLVTGALTRSDPFELQQATGRYGIRASEHAVALHPWAAAAAPLPLRAD